MDAVEEKAPGPAVNSVNFLFRLPRIGRYGLLLILLLALTTTLSWTVCYRYETVLEIRVNREGLSLPDGFLIWRHLDTNGVIFKSITPHHNGLMVRCVTSAECATARDVLSHSLPEGYTLALREDKLAGSSLLARLRAGTRRLG